MGRRYVIKKEPTTSLQAYVVDSMLIDSFQKTGESKPETLRRIFTAFFGEDRVEEMKREIQKKLDRQRLLHSDGDQSTIDNMYYPQHTLKDITYSRRELVDMIVDARGTRKKPLGKRNADDSIIHATNRGMAEIDEDGRIKVIAKWW